MKVLLRLDTHDGNEPIEGEIEVGFLPRQGDQIEAWDRATNNPVWLDVEHVVFCAYAPERIEVWVALEGYDLDAAVRVLADPTATP